MVKSWLTTLWQGIIGRSIRLVGRIWAVSPGAWIAGAVILFIGIQLFRVHKSHGDQDHRQKIAAAFGAANTFLGVPQMNHDGSRFTYVATTETRSCALYLYDARDKHEREIVTEQNGLGYWTDEYDLRAWAWSPDDSSFIYSMLDKLVICPADPKTNPVELTVGTNTVSQVVWLTPAKFAFVQRGNILCSAQKQVNGQWQQRELPFQDNISSLTAIGTNTVAWLQNGLICHLNLDENLDRTNNPFLASTPAANAAIPTNGLALWLDASTLRQLDQTPVDRLADLSSKRNEAIANKAAPVYNSPDSPRALRGKGTIHFSSHGSLTNATGLRTSYPLGITGATLRTVIVVMRRNPGAHMLVSLGDFGAEGAYFGLCDQNDALYLPANFFPSHKYADNRFPRSSASWNIMEVVSDGTTQAGYVNGRLMGTTSFPLNTADKPVEIGLRTIKEGSVYALGSNGDLAELLIYDRALGISERREVEGYLSAKWFGGKVITTQSPLVWVDPQMNGVSGFNYSKSTGQLLISVQNGPDTTLWRYDFNTGMSRLALAGPIQNAQWVGPNEFAYIGSKSGHRQIVLADSSGAEKSRLFQHGNIGWFNLASTGGKLLVSGVVSNEPANGFWQYDFETGQLQSLVSYSDHPSDAAKKIIPYQGSIRLPSGRSVNCLIYPPATVDHHKKYPLVITDTLSYDPIHGPMFQSAIADCGAYVAIVERGWWYDRIEQWGTNVLALYQNLKQDPAIDPQQVYLFGASAETQYMSELVEKTPGLWKGIILLNPSKLPDFSKSPRFQRRPKILIVAGGEEHEDERFKQYQADALKYGVMVEYVIAPGETHRFVGKAAKLERAEAVEHFIFEE
jgi:hypothetical protein